MKGYNKGSTLRHKKYIGNLLNAMMEITESYNKIKQK